MNFTQLKAHVQCENTDLFPSVENVIDMTVRLQKAHLLSERFMRLPKVFFICIKGRYGGQKSYEE